MPVRWTATSHSTNSSANTTARRRACRSHAPERLRSLRQRARSPRLRAPPAAEVHVPYSAGLLISITSRSSERAITLCATPAGCDRPSPACTRHVAFDAGEAEREPALQHDTRNAPSCRASASRSAAANGRMARMCLAPMRPPVAAARPRSRYSVSSRRPSRFHVRRRRHARERDSDSASARGPL